MVAYKKIVKFVTNVIFFTKDTLSFIQECFPSDQFQLGADGYNLNLSNAE